MNGGTWNQGKLLRIVNKVAKSLKIFFGNQTYPELMSDLQDQKEASFSFFNGIQQRTAIFVQKKS